MGDRQNFLWYESWWDTVLSFDERLGKDFGNKLIRNIIYYGMTGEFLIEENDIDYGMITGYISGSIAPNINKAKDRYKKACESGNKGGRPPALNEEDNALIADMRINQRIRQVDIAEYFGVDTKTIRNSSGWQNPERYLDKNREKPEKPENSGNKLDKDKEIDNEKEIEIDEDTGLPLSVLRKIAEQNNLSLEYVKMGIKMKEPEVWQKWGYGLFTKDDFRNEIFMKMEEQKAKEQEVKKNQEIVRRQIEDRIIIKVPSFYQENKKKKKEIDLDTLIE